MNNFVKSTSNNNFKAISFYLILTAAILQIKSWRKIHFVKKKMLFKSYCYLNGTLDGNIQVISYFIEIKKKCNVKLAFEAY